jgi:hypothetical protein
MDDISAIKIAKGLGSAHLSLFEDRLRIERKGWRAFLFQGTTGDIDIKLSSINDIQLKKASFRHRYMRFLFVKSAKNKGIDVYYLNATGIRFRAKQQAAFEEIKGDIEKRKNNGHSDQ